MKISHCIVGLAALAFAASTVVAQSAQRALQLARQQVVSANTVFACDLYAQVKGAGGNLFFSPVNVSSALAMIYAGAKGDTAAQLQKALRLSASPALTHAGFAALLKRFDEARRDVAGERDFAAEAVLARVDESRADDSVRLIMANSLWLQWNAQAPLFKEYYEFARQYYGAEFAPADFARAEPEARARINQWAAGRTQDKIRNLASAPLARETRMLLAGAAYFKGSWGRAFKPGDTFKAPFFAPDGSEAPASLMRQRRVFKYAALSYCQLIELPYEKGGISMLVVLPADKSAAGLALVEKVLSEKQIAGWRAQLNYADVQVFLPKFAFEWGTISFAKALQNLGIGDAFVAGKADFSGINGTKNFVISDVIQKASVAVDESGSEASAAAPAAVAPVVSIAGTPRPPPVFRADHAFLFFIQDNDTGSILFMGRVVKP